MCWLLNGFLFLFGLRNSFVFICLDDDDDEEVAILKYTYHKSIVNYDYYYEIVCTLYKGLITNRLLTSISNNKNR